MGIKLSDMGGLTFSQKKTCGGDKAKETALLKKLSNLSMNKSILEEVKHRGETRKAAAQARKAEAEVMLETERVAKAKTSTARR